jgi:Fic family protein
MRSTVHVRLSIGKSGKRPPFVFGFVAPDVHDAQRRRPMNSTRTLHELTDLTTRARAEFREMPGMCLTTAQAARLWQLSPDQAQNLLQELVKAGILVRQDGQRYRLPSSV